MKKILLLGLMTFLLNACQNTETKLTSLKMDDIQKMTIAWQYDNKIELYEIINKDRIDDVLKLLKNADIENCCRSQHVIGYVDLYVYSKDSLKKSINIYFILVEKNEVYFRYSSNYYRNDSLYFFLKEIGVEPSLFK